MTTHLTTMTAAETGERIAAGDARRKRQSERARRHRDCRRQRRRGELVVGNRRRERAGVYNFRYSLRRRVWVRLTGISVAFSSFILRM